MKQLTLYGRQGCHLCDDALAVIERVRAVTPFALDVVDIDTDESLLLRYLESIPVLLIDGEPRFHFFVDEAALLAAVANLSRPACEPTSLS